MAKRKSAKQAGKKADKKNKTKPSNGQKDAKSSKKSGKGGKEKRDGKGSKKADSLEPKPVKTGKGAAPAEVGAGVVEMIRAGAPETEIWDKYFSPKFVSIEGGMAKAWHGRPAVRAKAEWWYGAHKVHSLSAEGPYLGATGFGVKYSMDVEEIETGKRIRGDELAFYTVKNGRVIQEEFMGMWTPPE